MKPNNNLKKQFLKSLTLEIKNPLIVLGSNSHENLKNSEHFKIWTLIGARKAL